jgi:hypothetical protein
MPVAVEVSIPVGLGEANAVAGGFLRRTPVVPSGCAHTASPSQPGPECYQHLSRGLSWLLIPSGQMVLKNCQFPVTPDVFAPVRSAP